MLTIIFLEEIVKQIFQVGLIVGMFFISACVMAQPKSPTSFKECVAQGNKILRTFPGKCITSTGEVFVDDLVRIPLEHGERLCVDKCGDGICQEIVCMGEGCPCSEDPIKCPKDCGTKR